MGLLEASQSKPRKRRSPIKVKTGLSPTVIPAGFTLVIDTREQIPLFSPPPIGLDCVIETVHNGDYTIKGFEPYFVVERKRISDLYTYLTTEWDKRTVKKLEAMRDMQANGGWCALAIEASEADLLAGYEHSRINPECIRGGLLSVSVRYGVHIYYNRDRNEMARWLLDSAVRFYNIKREV